jgi:hypothetical protein
MAAGGVRDLQRALHVSPNTILTVIRQEAAAGGRHLARPLRRAVPAVRPSLLGPNNFFPLNVHVRPAAG